MKKWLCVLLTLALLTMSTALADMTDGAYTASAKGNNGDVTVAVTIEAGKIAAVEVTEHAETAGISDPAIERVPQAIVETQSLAVDTVTGATHTSDAILAAVADCVAQAGGDVEAMSVKAESAEAAAKTEETVDTDVLVVGGGVAGLTASMAAADAGAKVTLIDKMPSVGGTAAISGGRLIAVGSQLYAAEASETDNIESMLDYWHIRMSFSDQDSGYPDWDRLQGVLEDTGKTIDYLAENGMEWDETLYTGFGPFPVAAAKGSGSGFVEELLSIAESKGVTVLTGTKATALVLDGDKVTGAVAESEDAVIRFNAKSVVLATGGISQNPELVAKYSPKDAFVIPEASVSNTGDGLLLAIEAGAGVFDEFATAINKAVVDPALAAVADTSKLTTPAQLGVNAKGERFASEDPVYRDVLAGYMIQNQNPPYFFIYDSADADIAAVLEAGAEADVVAKGQTIEELAGAMGVDAAALRATYDAYAQAVAAGEDAQFGKDASKLVALDTAPFYAVKFFPSTFGSVGGVFTSEEGRVLREDGSVIEGLYAAGEMSNRYYYDVNYICGASLGLYSTMGLRTGGTAAADALK